MPHSLRLLVPALLLLAVYGTATSASAASPPATATSAAALAARVPDTTTETLPGGFVALLPEPYAAPRPAVDRRYGWHFSRAAYLYAPGRASVSGVPAASLSLSIVLHHEPQDLDRARLTIRLLARLLRLHRERFGRDTTFPRDADTVDVWLATETPPQAREAGGECRDNQVYLFATGAQRTPIEWVRTITHEWGHLTLPAAEGYSAPEADASGYLGERLYIRWLREDRAHFSFQDGVTTDGVNLYWERQIAPLMDRFAISGPTAPLLGGKDADAMDLYIGGVLSADAAFGSEIMGRALRTIEGVRPQDFFVALRHVVDTETWAPLPVRLPAWVPLEKGRYVVNGSVPLRVGASTWRYLTSPSQATLKRIAPQPEAQVR